MWRTLGTSTAVIAKLCLLAFVACDRPVNALHIEADGGAHADDAGPSMALGKLCPSARQSPEAPGLFLVVGSDVVLVRADATRRVLYRLAGSPDWALIEQQGDIVIVQAAHRASGGYAQVAAFRRDGGLIWNAVEETGGQPPYYVRVKDDGVGVMYGQEGSWAFHPEGARMKLDNAHPVGAHDKDGWVPIAVHDKVGVFGFVHPVKGERRALALPVLGLDPAWLDERFVHFSATPDGQLAIVDERPGDARVQALSRAANDDAYLRIERRGRAALLLRNG